jgi:CRISPR-associated protein Cas1
MELILNTFGVSLNRDNEAFVITKKGERHRIPVDDVKSIQISRGAQITSDAVMLAIENEIEVLFMDRSGKPMGRVWSPRYGSISTIRKGQLNFTSSHAALEWIKEVIMQKMENQQALMLLLQPRDTGLERERKRNIDRIEDYRIKVSKLG